MRDIAGDVIEAMGRGRSVRVARVVGFRGFGGRRAGEALAVFGDGKASGSLLGGAADTAVAETLGAGKPSVLLELALGDTEAVAAGLACGGVATVLASDGGQMPEAFWNALGSSEPVALVTRPEREDGASVLTIVESLTGDRELHGSLGDALIEDEATEAARQALRTGRDSAQVVELRGGIRVVVEAFFPSTTLLVVGEGQLPGALAAQGALLGWTTATESGWSSATAAYVRSFRRSDAIVVLSHDPEVDTPALAAALETGCFVGALGSRHTQAGRRDRLRGAPYRLDAATIERIHGPVGLDLGARTPEETAVAVAAEFLAFRSRRSATSLRSSDGPING